MISALAIIEAETPKKALSAAGFDGFFTARGFTKASLWSYMKRSPTLNIYVRRLSGGGGKVWQLVVEVFKHRHWRQVENTLHQGIESLLKAVSVYDSVSEAETPKKVLRQVSAKAAHSKASEREHEEFLGGYIAAALWSSHDDRYEGGDENLEGEELAPETEKRMRVDCWTFLNDNYERIAAGKESLAHAGQDFWLSRCGHGSGFFDSDYGGHEHDLQDAARAWGNIDLYVGDDGLVYES